MCLGKTEVWRGELLFCRYPSTKQRESLRVIYSKNSIPFQDNASRTIWFHGPIAVMLLLNTVGCVQIVRLLCANENRKLKMHLREPNKRNAKMDKYYQMIMYILCLKLKSNETSTAHKGSSSTSRSSSAWESYGCLRYSPPTSSRMSSICSKGCTFSGLSFAPGESQTLFLAGEMSTKLARASTIRKGRA